MNRQLFRFMFACTAFASIVAGAANRADAVPVDLINDNFNTENGGVGVYNYSGFANFNVTQGSVDLLPVAGDPNNAIWQAFAVTQGLFIDLDGTTNTGGKLETNPLALAAGTYQLSFDLAGSQRLVTPTDTVTVSLGGLFSQMITLPSATPFGTFNFAIIAGAPSVGTLSFLQAGGDNQGLLLDNVRLTFDAAATPVPEPASFLLWGLGAIAVTGYQRRRSARSRIAARG